MVEEEKIYTPEQMIAYADSRNREKGRNALRWLRVNPEDDPDLLIGIDPDSNSLVGPSIRRGRRYKIVYRQPMILPFGTPKEGNVVFHIAEIEGTLDPTGTLLLDTKLTMCAPNDYSIRQTASADKSVFRLCRDDKIEEVELTVKYPIL